MKKTVEDITDSNENVIFLNAGDIFQGNIWHTNFKWEVAAKFANQLGFTAMVRIIQIHILYRDGMPAYIQFLNSFCLQCPGNHEFDGGVEGFEPFLKNITFPMVCCNMDMTDAPELKSYIIPSVVIEIGGRKIGIIGYVTTDTPVIHLYIHDLDT